MRWYFLAFKKYATFKGRSRRKEYWMFALVNTLIGLPLICIVLYNILTGSERTAVLTPVIILLAYSLATFLPSLALTVRRLHDIEYSGAWLCLDIVQRLIQNVSLYLVKSIFLKLIALALGIWFFVLLVRDGTVGPNEYGEDPKNRLIYTPPSVTPRVRPEAASNPEQPILQDKPITFSFGKLVKNAVAADIIGLRLSQSRARVGETVTVFITYKNSDAEDKEVIVTLYVNGVFYGKQQVLASANSSGEIPMEVSFSHGAIFTIKSGDFSTKIYTAE